MSQEKDVNDILKGEIKFKMTVFFAFLTVAHVSLFIARVISKINQTQIFSQINFFHKSSFMATKKDDFDDYVVPHSVHEHFHYLESESNHIKKESLYAQIEPEDVSECPENNNMKRNKMTEDRDDLLNDLSCVDEDDTETDSINSFMYLEPQFRHSIYDTDFPPVQKTIKIMNCFTKDHPVQLLNEFMKLPKRDKAVIIHLHFANCFIDISVYDFIIQLEMKCRIFIKKISFDGCIHIPENCLNELVTKSSIDTYLITECFCLKESHYLEFLRNIKRRTKKIGHVPFTSTHKVEVVIKYENIANMDKLIFMILCDCFIRPINPTYNKEFVLYHGVGYRSMKTLKLEEHDQSYYKHVEGTCLVCTKSQQFYNNEKTKDHFVELNTVTLPTLSFFFLFGDRTNIANSVQVEKYFNADSIVEDVVSYMEKKVLSCVVSL